MATSESGLKSEIRFADLFAIGFGTVVGVGWMIMGGSWILNAGPVFAALAFLLGALAVGLVTLCYAELGAMYPNTGAEVVYAFEGLGLLPSFAIGWLLSLVYVAWCAFEGLAAAWIISILIPGSAGPVLYQFLGSDISLLDVVVATGGTIALTVLNYRGGGLAASFQSWATWALGGATLLFVLGALFGGSAENARPLLHGVDGTAWSGFLAILATAPAWYAGFNALPQALGELDRPERVRSLSLLLAAVIAAAFLFYFGVILAVAFAAPRSVLQGAELPVADALFTVFESRWLGNTVLVAGLLGIVTTWNAMLFSGARVLLCLGRANLIHGAFAGVHPRFGSPANAVLFVGVLGSAAALLGRAILEPILNMTSICFTVSYLFTALALLRLRRTRPQVARPWRMPGYPWLPRSAVLVSCVFIALGTINIAQSARDGAPVEFLILIAWCLLGGMVWTTNRRGRDSIGEVERAARMHAR